MEGLSTSHYFKMSNHNQIKLESTSKFVFFFILPYTTCSYFSIQRYANNHFILIVPIIAERRVTS